MRPQLLAVGAALLVVLAAVPFVVTPSPQARSGAVAWGATKPTGVPESVVARAEHSGLVLPKAQAYYAHYRYVVGYYGVTSLVASLQTQDRREYGRLLTLYVSDFSGTNPTLTSEGFLRIPSGRATDWVRARAAYFVVDSTARIPTREHAIVPFSERSDAVAFADRYGGRVVRWQAARSSEVGRATRSVDAWQREVRQRSRRANRTAARARRLLGRPVARTVSTASGLRAALREVPANTTIRLAPGTYDVSALTVRRPVTIRGAGPNRTRLVGDGNGSVVTVTAPRTALADLAITGVGDVRSGANRSTPGVPVPRDSILYRFWTVHGYGDAGVVFATAGRSLVADVRINTTSNGVIVRRSDGVTVTNLTVFGTRSWRDGFLGVAALGSRVLVQDTAFYGGKVGVFVLDTAGVVVRDCRMEGMMVGVFDLYAPRLLVADTSVADTWNAIYVETRSTGTAVVDNVLRNSRNGLVVSGRANYVAANRLLHNHNGLLVKGQFAVYRHNLVAFNDVGARVLTLFPTNRVTTNDFAGNGAYATTPAFNVLHVWPGNYWWGAPGLDVDGDGELRRTFVPTGPVDSLMAEAVGARTLGRSPALHLLRSLQRLVPGLQAAGVVDPRPRATPVHDVSRVLARHDDPGPQPDDDPWDFTQ